MGVLYKEARSFFSIFRQKGGGSLGRVKKNPFQKKLKWSKKDEGGGLSFLSESKKTVFFVPHLIIWMALGRIHKHKINFPFN